MQPLLSAIDWKSAFVPEMSLLELILRGTVMYLILFALLRVLARRHAGPLSMMDLLMIVLIADAAQNAMAGQYKSITEGVILCATIIGWSVLLDWLAFRFPKLRPLLESSPLPLIRNGRIQRKNLRQEFITEDELISLLRQQGIEDVKEVKIAHLEPDGQFSVIKQQPDQDDTQIMKHKKQAGIS